MDYGEFINFCCQHCFSKLSRNWQLSQLSWKGGGGYGYAWATYIQTDSIQKPLYNARFICEISQFLNVQPDVLNLCILTWTRQARFKSIPLGFFVHLWLITIVATSSSERSPETLALTMLSLAYENEPSVFASRPEWRLLPAKLYSRRGAKTDDCFRRLLTCHHGYLSSTIFHSHRYSLSQPLLPKPTNVAKPDKNCSKQSGIAFYLEGV